MLLDFLKQKNECRHERVPIDTDEAYCPDCGALIKNKWYLVRCNCCNIKRKAHSKYNEILPDTLYCPNCGGSEFYIEELDNVNFIDVNYAVYKKVVVEQGGSTTRQIWIEQENKVISEKKLISAKHQ